MTAIKSTHGSRRVAPSEYLTDDRSNISIRNFICGNEGNPPRGGFMNTITATNEGDRPDGESSLSPIGEPVAHCHSPSHSTIPEWPTCPAVRAAFHRWVLFLPSPSVRSTVRMCVEFTPRVRRQRRTRTVGATPAVFVATMR